MPSPPPAHHTSTPDGSSGDVAARRFQLHRSRDVSGVSGTGVVADGVEFPDGGVVVRWRGRRPSTVVWSSVDDVHEIHGHGGATRVVWLDERLVT